MLTPPSTAGESCLVSPCPTTALTPKPPFPCSYTLFPFNGTRGPGTAPQLSPQRGVGSGSFCLRLLLLSGFYPRQRAGAVPEPQPTVGLGHASRLGPARGLSLCSAMGLGTAMSPGSVSSINPQVLESRDGGKVKPTPSLALGEAVPP